MITDGEYLDILRGLEECHAIFYQLWEMGRPVFTEEVDTAAVSFDLQDQLLAFKFNPHFWDSLSDYSRLFVIAHEALHVLLNHGVRSGTAHSEEERRDLNIAMDVTVNTQLLTSFGFRREVLDERIAQEGCFLDTVFGADHGLVYHHFEHIYRQLGTVDLDEGAVWGFDDHGGLDDIPEDLVEEVAERASDRMSNEEIREVNEALEESSAGDYTPLATLVPSRQQVEENEKWAEVIERWVDRNRPSTEIEERWDRRPRRLQSVGGSLAIPREKVIEDFDKTRVTFFIDTSGSCRKLADRFMRCVDSVPGHLFDVDLYCFDIQPYPIDLKTRKLRGFGGTKFHPLEYHLEKQVRKGSPYPEAVFILTDGWGSPIEPRHPERWHWFLTDDGTERYVPRESKMYWLSEFE